MDVVGVDIDVNFDKVFLWSAYEEIIKNNHIITVEQVKSFIQMCYSNMSYIKGLGLFNLCEDLIVNDRFGEFYDCVLQIVALNPEILYEVGITEYNLFMTALDYYYKISPKKLIAFLNELNRMMVTGCRELRLGYWDVLNAVSGSDIPIGEEYKHYDDRKTILILAFETKNFEVIETCILMGCYRIYPDDNNEPLEFFDLIETIISKYCEYSVYSEDDDIYIDNFENKFKILLAIGYFEEIGMNSIFFGIAEDLNEYMMESLEEEEVEDDDADEDADEDADDF
jgi:hypothetical protein